MSERLFVRLWHGTAPLVLWAAHFFFCYLLAAAGCGAATWAVLVAATVIALGLAGWLVATACRRMPSRTLLDLARLGSAVLATTGIAWSALPLLAFGGCR